MSQHLLVSKNVRMYVLMHIVTFSHLRSKEFIDIHLSCMPHSRDTTKCRAMYNNVHADVAWKMVHIKEAQCKSKFFDFITNAPWFLICSKP